MTSLLLVRHPETTWNAEKRYQGRLDAPLSTRGHAQAQSLAAAFRGESVDRIVTSPLGRASCLAQLLSAETGAPLAVDSRLTEIAQGPWEGMYLDQIHRMHRALYQQWYARPDLVHFPGGESIATVSRRVLAACEDVYRSCPHGVAIVVSHSVVIQAVILAALHLETRYLHQVRVSNCGVTTLCGNTAPGIVLTLNSTEMLHGSPLKAALAENCSTVTSRRVTT